MKQPAEDGWLVQPTVQAYKLIDQVEYILGRCPAAAAASPTTVIHFIGAPSC
jgi:acetyl-CoA carboxylase carboxyltransferase component